MTLEEFLKLAEVRIAVSEAVGEALGGIGKALSSGRLGGQQLAYEALVLVVSGEPIKIAEGYLDLKGCTADNVAQHFKAIVAAQREQAATQRMTARVAVKFGVVDANLTIGNALLLLSEPDAAPADEILLLVCCAGLAGLHNERYAELMAAHIKDALLDMRVELNAATGEGADGTVVVDMFRPGRPAGATTAQAAA